MIESSVAHHFEIRAAGRNDAKALVKLTLDFLRELRIPPDRARVRRAYEECLARPKDFPTFLLHSGDQPVGYALAFLHPSTHHGVVMRVHDLYVDPAVRNLGAGHRLVEHLIEHARKAGAAKLEMELADANVDARRLFGRLGFRPAGRCISSLDL